MCNYVTSYHLVTGTTYCEGLLAICLSTITRFHPKGAHMGPSGIIGVKGSLNLNLTMRKLHQLTCFIDRNKI